MSNAIDPDQSEVMERIIPVRMPDELVESAEAAAKRLGLKRADVIRLALARGIPVLIDQLESNPQAAADATSP